MIIKGLLYPHFDKTYSSVPFLSKIVDVVIWERSFNFMINMHIAV